MILLEIKFQKMVPQSIISLGKGLWQKNLSEAAPKIPASVQQQLAGKFDQDMKSLEEMLGISLNQWRN